MAKVFGYPTVFAALALLAVYPLQILRIAIRRSKDGRSQIKYAALIVIGKFAELGGMARFYRNNRRGYAPRIIEYKNGQ